MLLPGLQQYHRGYSVTLVDDSTGMDDGMACEIVVTDENNR